MKRASREEGREEENVPRWLVERDETLGMARVKEAVIRVHSEEELTSVEGQTRELEEEQRGSLRVELVER